MRCPPPDSLPRHLPLASAHQVCMHCSHLDFICNMNLKNNDLNLVSVLFEIVFYFTILIRLLLTALVICYDLDCYIVVHVYYAE